MGGSAVPAGVIAHAVAAAKAYLRLEGAEEDAVLSRLAATAIALGEAYCGEALVTRDFVQQVAAAPGWQRLAACPVVAIDTVTAVEAGALAIDRYAIDIDADAIGWVRTAVRVRVAYRAGAAADWDQVPAAVAQGVVLMIAHLFTHDAPDHAPPAAVAALWRPFRRLRIGRERRR